MEKNVVKSTYSMWDAFENVLLFISLYVYSTSVALFLHLLVDKYYPGVSDSTLTNPSLDDWQLVYIRSLMAAIIVSFPLFAFFFYRISKRTLENLVIKNLDSRKKLIYFTLVVTFIILIVNIISIVYNFLGGNTTTNFVLHFLITIGISGFIFAYYLRQIREDRKVNV